MNSETEPKNIPAQESAQLERENKALREALEAILETAHYGDSTGYWHVGHEAIGQARAALRGEDGK